MLVAEQTVGLSWVSVKDRLPFDGHECALIYRDPTSNNLRRTIGCRLHGNWEIENCAPGNWDVRAWLKLRRFRAIFRGTQLSFSATQTVWRRGLDSNPQY